MARSIRMFTDQGRLFVPFWRPGRVRCFVKESLPKRGRDGGKSFRRTVSIKFLTTHLIFDHLLAPSFGKQSIEVEAQVEAQVEALGIGVRQRRKIWLTFRRGGCNNAIKQFGMVQ